MIELCNLRRSKPSQPWDVKVDRSSVLGNPYNTGTRDFQCDSYRDSFESRVNENPAMLQELRRIYQLHKKYGKLRLFCWCTPLRCHSETIKSFLSSTYNAFSLDWR